ncbi:AAA family ATPase, partial [Akkermansiaceae bacterium]|nr:AAA family ATPase [Akkermansiaceae bacterium]
SLIHALGRCIVFVDEADQALGKRQGGSGDSGVSSRVYSMMAKEMSNTRNRGKVLWVLASSRPDLIEVDLKRPGRIDVKIPLFPCVSDEQSFALIRALAKRRGLIIEKDALDGLRGKLPKLLTPGAAEALAVQLFRVHKTSNLEVMPALEKCLEVYRPPVKIEILKAQMQLAVEEATDASMIPDEVTEILKD